MQAGSGGHVARFASAAVAAAIVLGVSQPSAAQAAVAHTVIEGETLSGIAAANGISTESLASWNGISAETLVTIGQTVYVPSAEELGITTSTTSTTTTTTAAPTVAPATAPASWTVAIYSPLGAAYLDAGAAAQWEAMRQAGVATYGIDIYPAGPLSAYRTYAQQAYLYDLYLSGAGAPANPPGSSPHEYGTSVDLASPEMRTVIDNLGPTYGWGKVHGPTEWWHVDYLG